MADASRIDHRIQANARAHEIAIDHAATRRVVGGLIEAGWVMDIAVRGAVGLGRLFRMAVVAGVESAVQLHIDRGDDLDARDDNGQTPLMLAAARNRTGVCRLLLDAGANAHLLSPSGLDALRIALAANATDAAAAIADRVAAPTPQSRSYSETETALDAADAPTEFDGDSRLAMDAEPAAAQSAMPSAPLPLVCELDEADAEAFGDWEAEEVTEPPENNPELALAASRVQESISSHRAVDATPTWDDFDAPLPERASTLRRPENPEAAESLRLLLLRSLREGSVPEALVDDASIDIEGAIDAEAARLLAFVINDLGAETDERFEYTAAHENFAVAVDAEADGEEESAVAEALDFIDEAGARRNEPLRIYQREFQGESLLSAESEAALGQAMEREVETALDELARWQNGIDRTIAVAKLVAVGKRPMRSMSEGGQAEPRNVDEGGQPGSEAQELSARGDDDRSEDLETEDGLSEFAASVALLESSSASSDGRRVREALGSLQLSRAFLVELAEGADISTEGEAFARAARAYLAARDKMAVANLKLAFSIAKKYMFSGQPLDDLVQEANLGLMRAVDRYDWRRGFKFSTYATWWIRQSVTRFLADRCKTIRLPVHVYEKTQRIAHAAKAFESLHGRAPNIQELADAVSMPAPKVAMLGRAVAEPLAMDEVEDLDGSIAIEDRDALLGRDPLDALADRRLASSIDDALSGLPSKEQFVLRSHFGVGIGQPMTLEEIGQQLELTRERVRQIEAATMRRMCRSPHLRSLISGVEGYRAPRARDAVALIQLRDDPIALGDPPPEVAPAASPSPTDAATRPSRVRRTRSSIYASILDDARALGIHVTDDREGDSRRLWIHISKPTDGNARRLVRKLNNLGFAFWPGKGFWV